MDSSGFWAQSDSLIISEPPKSSQDTGRCKKSWEFYKVGYMFKKKMDESTKCCAHIFLDEHQEQDKYKNLVMKYLISQFQGL